jgi:hypothetical protein
MLPVMIPIAALDACSDSICIGTSRGTTASLIVRQRSPQSIHANTFSSRPAE